MLCYMRILRQHALQHALHCTTPVLSCRRCCLLQLCPHLSRSAPLLHSTPCPLQVSHIEQPENWAAVEAAKVIYSAGFFITVSPEAIAKTSQHCCEKGKIYCMVSGHCLGGECQPGVLGCRLGSGTCGAWWPSKAWATRKLSSHAAVCLLHCCACRKQHWPILQ